MRNSSHRVPRLLPTCSCSEALPLTATLHMAAADVPIPFSLLAGVLSRGLVLTMRTPPSAAAGMRHAGHACRVVVVVVL